MLNLLHSIFKNNTQTKIILEFAICQIQKKIVNRYTELVSYKKPLLELVITLLNAEREE